MTPSLWRFGVLCVCAAAALVLQFWLARGEARWPLRWVGRVVPGVSAVLAFQRGRRASVLAYFLCLAAYGALLAWPAAA